VAIATGSGVEIWDYASQRVVASVDHQGARVLAFVEADQRLVTMGETGAYTWDLGFGRGLAMQLQRSDGPRTDQMATERELTEVCRRVGRNLTAEEWQTYLGEDEPYSPACADLARTTASPDSASASIVAA
jgi:hypothetical protein